MIHTPQFWLPDRLRDRREDEWLMRGRGGLSRRWMPGYPCCCNKCNYPCTCEERTTCCWNDWASTYDVSVDLTGLLLPAAYYDTDSCWVIDDIAADDIEEYIAAEYVLGQDHVRGGRCAYRYITDSYTTFPVCRRVWCKVGSCLNCRCCYDIQVSFYQVCESSPTYRWAWRAVFELIQIGSCNCGGWSGDPAACFDFLDEIQTYREIVWQSSWNTTRTVCEDHFPLQCSFVSDNFDGDADLVLPCEEGTVPATIDVDWLTT